jgi:hypothetical protein
MNVESIARVCHEVNRAYCQAIGDDSQPTWDDAPAWMRDSIISGVQFHLDNPDAGPETSHEKWVEHKAARGWTHGPLKDHESKQHPCMVLFAELPIVDQAKDYIFRAIVYALGELGAL